MAEEITADTKKLENKKIDDAYITYYQEHNDRGIKADAKRLIIVILGALLIGFNMKVFLNQGELLPAGLNGIATLIQRLVKLCSGIDIPFWPVSVVLNIAPAVMAFRTVGKRFTMFSCLAILIMSFATDIFTEIQFTNDRILIAVFGGIINGFANSMILRCGASTGGFDFIAMYFSAKKGKSAYNYVLAVNVVVIMISAISFGMESALYTVIYQFVATVMINTIFNRYAKKTLFIVTEKPEVIADAVMSCTHHACTEISGRGTYSGTAKRIVYAVIGANEEATVRRIIKVEDEKAFINVIRSENVFGRFYQPVIG